MTTSRAPSWLRGLSFDLDDTLWPVWPAIKAAEAELRAWLERHAPATARRYDAAGLLALREELVRTAPPWRHDLSRLRRECLALALTRSGDDPALSGPAFEVFFAARNRVRCFDDAVPALEALSARWPLVALTNGNADLGRIGLAGHFIATVSAASVGAGKPDPRMFGAACHVLGMAPPQVLHVGDDWAIDVCGAERAGLRSAWVCRGEAAPTAPDAQARPAYLLRHLGELVDRLLG